MTSTPKKMPPVPPKKESQGLLYSLGKASTMGLHMVSGILVGCGMGYALDRWLGTSPWLFGLFGLLGIAAGFRNLWSDAQLLIGAEKSRHEQNKP